MADPSAYPLQWPAGWPRTTPRQKAQYRTTLAGALKNLRAEVRLLCGDAAERTLILSSNVTLGAERPADPGNSILEAIGVERIVTYRFIRPTHEDTP